MRRAAQSEERHGIKAGLGSSATTKMALSTCWLANVHERCNICSFSTSSCCFADSLYASKAAFSTAMLPAASCRVGSEVGEHQSLEPATGRPRTAYGDHGAATGC